MRRNGIWVSFYLLQWPSWILDFSIIVEGNRKNSLNISTIIIKWKIIKTGSNQNGCFAKFTSHDLIKEILQSEYLHIYEIHLLFNFCCHSRCLHVPPSRHLQFVNQHPIKWISGTMCNIERICCMHMTGLDPDMVTFPHLTQDHFWSWDVPGRVQSNMKSFFYNVVNPQFSLYHFVAAG
jgi:hypothetical protein